MRTFWRSAAKPFQALPLLQDGGADRFGFTSREIALTCASHSSEEVHIALARAMLERIGQSVSALACGPHTPLSSAVSERVVREGIELTPLWSNCSGKHAGMLAQAVANDWPIERYHELDHPLQQRILEEIARWSGVPTDEIDCGLDGCNTVCFGLPLRAMALAYARLAGSDDPAAQRIREAMTANPLVVAGLGRPCTDLMAAFDGRLIAKVGAEGVYCAAFIPDGIGIALKVHDGDMKSLPVALLAVLRSVLERGLVEGLGQAALDAVASHGGGELRNTRGRVTGVIRSAGAMHYLEGVSA